MIYTEHEYLMHEGVKDMRWHHRNGPPYPLGLDQMTSAQKKANASKGWFKRKLEEAKEKRQAKKDAKEAKKVEEKLAKQAHKQGRLSEQERNEVYRKADVKTAFEHVTEYSNKEIQSILDRYDMQQRLKEKVSNINYKEKMKGKEKIDIATKYLDSVVNIGRKAADIYNIAAAVGNAFGDKQWKPIKIGEFPRNNNNNKKDDNEFDSKLSDEKKKKLFKSGDINEAKKYKEELTNKELQNILDRHYKYQALDKAVNKANKSDDDDSSDNKSNNKQNNNQNQNNYQKDNSYKKSYDNGYKKSYDNNYSKSSDTKSSSYDSKKNTESAKPATEKKTSGNARGIKNQSWSILNSTSGNYSDFISDNSSKGESWLSSYLDSYPKSKSTSLSKTKTSYSDNHVKDDSGNKYRMISTGGKLTEVDSGYITSGENWFSNWSASYDMYDDKKK